MEKIRQQQKNKTSFTDQLDRPLHDLRISVTDRCNFRCTYCMPDAQEDSFMRSEQWLSFDEIHQLVRNFVGLGVNKVRITGGEPLLRPNVAELIKDLRSIDGISDLALTTNGSLLTAKAEDLKKAGLDRITVSLDTLNPNTFLTMNGVKEEPAKIIESIFYARRIGFKDIKVNTVIQKGVNEDDILPLVDIFRNTGVTLRFIEYMDVGTCNNWSRQDVFSSEDILKRIDQVYPLKALSPNCIGEVATRYAFCDGSGELGFISSVSQPFCQDCSRARLSADGQLYTCLFASKGTFLKPLLHQTDEEIQNFLKGLWQKRKDRYSESRFLGIPENQQDKVEMFRIGG